MGIDRGGRKRIHLGELVRNKLKRRHIVFVPWECKYCAKPIERLLFEKLPLSQTISLSCASCGYCALNKARRRNFLHVE
jgi:hypothetical protein